MDASEVSSGNGSSAEDPLSPYYTHRSDNIGTPLVSQILTGDNYGSWIRSMEIALSARNKIGFTNGTIKKPSDQEPDLLNLWIRNNNIVISWTLNSVSKEIAGSLLYCNTAEELWTDLRDRFQQNNGPKIFQLRHQLMNLRQDQETISTHFTKIKTLWEELNNFRPICSCGNCSCGGLKRLMDYHQMEYVMTFLMGLNSDLAQARGQILLMDPIPPINRVFSLLSQEEKHKDLRNQLTVSGTSDNAAFMTKGSTGITIESNNTRKPNSNYKKERPFCTYCKIQSHTKEKCYKLYGYPPGYKSRRQSYPPKTPANSTNSVTDSNIEGNNQHSTPETGKVQIQQLISAFTQLLNNSAETKDSSISDSGPHQWESDWQG